MLRHAYGMGGIDVKEMADHQPVEQHAQRRQMLLLRMGRDLISQQDYNEAIRLRAAAEN